MRRLAAQRHRDVNAACSECEHPEAACRRRVTVASYQRCTRLSEPLHVNGMADAVAWPAIPDPEATAGGAQEQMLFSVRVVDLEQIVIDVTPSGRYAQGLS